MSWKHNRLLVLLHFLGKDFASLFESIVFITLGLLRLPFYIVLAIFLIK